MNTSKIIDGLSQDFITINQWCVYNIIRKDVCDTCNKGTRVLDVCQAKAVGWAMGIGL